MEKELKEAQFEIQVLNKKILNFNKSKGDVRTVPKRLTDFRLTKRTNSKPRATLVRFRARKKNCRLPD
jgi:hypothetical protein